MHGAPFLKRNGAQWLKSDAAARYEMLRRNGEADTIQEAGVTVELAGTPGGIWSIPRMPQSGRKPIRPRNR
jgi:hypothetical protein